MAYPTDSVRPATRRRAAINWEYRVYFTAILLLIAIPLASVRWTASLLHHRGASPTPGLIQQAASEARIITTTIFSA
jgi:hypothetical protein